MKKYILLTLIFMSYTAQGAWYPHITNYTTDNSNAGRQNWKITKNSNGWVYFANNEGVVEYNGYSWVVRPLENQSIVRSVGCTPSGEIYVGGRGEIGCFAPDDMGRLQYTNLVRSIPNELQNFDEVWNIHIIGEQVYFQLRRNILIMNANGEFRSIESTALIIASTTVNNSLYYATSEGIYVVGESEPIAINLSSEIPFGEICAMAPYQSGKLLIATSFDGLYIYDKGSIQRFRTSDDNSLMANQLYSLAVSDNYIACGTVKGGVITFAIDGSQMEQNSIQSGMSNNTVLSVMFDDQENLWCGLDNGIDYITFTSPIRYADINRRYRFSGYCTLLDGEHLYLGSNQGLVRIQNRSQEGVSPREDRRSVMVDNSDGQVWNIQRIGGEIFCCHNRGLFLIKQSRVSPTLEPIYTDDGVWNIIEISDKKVLACTYEGIVRLDKGADGSYSAHPIEGYRGAVRNMVMIEALRAGYFVSDRGLERVLFDADYSSLKCQRLLERESFDVNLFTLDGQLLAYTSDGVYRINDDGSAEHTSLYDALFDIGAKYSMIWVDPLSNIWYITDGQLLKRSYNDQTKLHDAQCQLIISDRNFFIPGFTRIDPLDEEHYIVGGVDGFSRINSNRRVTTKAEIKPRIIGLYDSKHRDSLLLSGAYGIEAESIELPHSSNSIHIVFANNTTHSQGVEYSYRLEGSDKEWSEWSRLNEAITPGANNQKEYTNLFEGDYTFAIRLRDSSGEVETSELGITVRPPWQRTKPMYLLYFVLFTLLAIYIRNAINRYYTNRRRLVELQSARQIENQKRHFESRAIAQENRIIKLKNEKLESEVIAKSAELSNLLLNKLEKNDIIIRVKEDLAKIQNEIVGKHYTNIPRRIASLNKHLDDKMIDNVDWSIFEDNFNITNNNFIQKICESYSWMNINERKLCVYIKMGLQNKEIAPLLNLSVRGVEMLRYRIRKKMGLERNENLYEFFQGIG